MSQENQGITSATPEGLIFGKRKRGRPRKDDYSDVSGLLGSDGARRNQRPRTDSPNCTDSDFVGQIVSGVLDGSFDAGYLLTVRVGDTGTLLRGLVFEPGLSVPISASNDVAPHVKMIKRNEILSPVAQPLRQVPVIALERLPTQPIKINMSAFPAGVPEGQRSDGSGPSKIGSNHVPQVATLATEYRSLADSKDQVQFSPQVSQCEKARTVEPPSMIETSVLSKGADADIDQASLISQQEVPPKVMLEPPTEKADATACTHGHSDRFSQLLSGVNQGHPEIGIKTTVVSQENETSAQTGPLSNAPSNDKNLESTNDIDQASLISQQEVPLKVMLEPPSEKVDATAHTHGHSDCFSQLLSGVNQGHSEIGIKTTVVSQEYETSAQTGPLSNAPSNSATIVISDDSDTAKGPSDGNNQEDKTSTDVSGDCRNVLPLAAPQAGFPKASNEIENTDGSYYVTEGQLTDAGEASGEDKEMMTRFDKPVVEVDLSHSEVISTEDNGQQSGLTGIQQLVHQEDTKTPMASTTVSAQSNDAILEALRIRVDSINNEAVEIPHELADQNVNGKVEALPLDPPTLMPCSNTD